MSHTLRNAGSGEPVGAGYQFADASGVVWKLDNWSPSARLCYAKDNQGNMREFRPYQLGLYFGARQ